MVDVLASFFDFFCRFGDRFGVSLSGLIMCQTRKAQREGPRDLRWLRGDQQYVPNETNRPHGRTDEKKRFLKKKEILRELVSVCQTLQSES